MPDNKKKNQKRHARKRFLERLGVPLTQDFRDRIIGKIRRGETKVLEKPSNRVTKHRILIDGISFDVIYDRKRKTIVTVLPQDER